MIILKSECLIKRYVILIAVITISVFSCSKDKTEDPANVIVFKEINKTIISPGVDSISGTCKDLRFEIITNSQSENIIILTTNSSLILCDGSSNIMADTITSKVLVLDEQTQISNEESWAGVRDLSLDDFAGLGEKYIGYRSCFFPEGIDQYRFGWIKIKLSPNKDTLTIISRADNQTINKAIAAGQVE